MTHVVACDKSPTSQRFVKAFRKESLTRLFEERGEVAPAKVLSASDVSGILADENVSVGFPYQDVSSLRRGQRWPTAHRRA